MLNNASAIIILRGAVNNNMTIDPEI